MVLRASRARDRTRAQEDLSIHTYLNDRYVEANPKELEILLRQCQVVVRGQAAAQ